MNDEIPIENDGSAKPRIKASARSLLPRPIRRTSE